MLGVKALRVRLALLPVMVLMLAATLSCGLIGGKKKEANKDELAVIETNYGRIVIEFLVDSAPQNVANIQSLAREGFYNGTRFHRVARETDQVTPMALQGGDPNTISDPESAGTWGNGKPDQETVPLEQSRTLKHERGVVSAYRKTDDANSATSQFFIMVKSAPQFDGQYSIIGRVIEGMNVVDAIVRVMGAKFPDGIQPEKDPRYVSRIYLIKRDEYKK
jgi:peptidyl-prolyl cis-trans isomerase B (cyclophilin B)